MQPEFLVVAGGVFLSVVLVVTLCGFMLTEHLTPERRRLQQLAARGAGARVMSEVGTLSRDADPDASRLRSFVPKSPKEMGRIQRQLARAGYRHPMAATFYALAEVVLPVVAFGIVVTVLGWGQGLILAIVAGLLGYLLPGLFLSAVIRRYKKEIRNGLADALDLIIVCVEAGSGLDQALMKSTEELAVSYPALSEELGLITTEVRAGKPRLEAFRNFAERTKVDDVQSLVTMLVQTDRFGTSIAQTLRTYADVLRTKRRQRAEEKAAKLGVKLVFPLVLCLFPALYVVALGPAVLRMIRFFQSQ